MKQISQRQNESAIERSHERALLEQNKQEDAAHWDNEHRVQEQRKQKRLAYERDLLSQIDERRQSNNNSPNLHINKDYIQNIKQIKDLLAEEISLKESVIVPKTTGKRLIAQAPHAISVVGLHGQKATDARSQQAGG